MMKKLFYPLMLITLLAACKDDSETWFKYIDEFRTNIQILENRNSLIMEEYNYYLFLYKARVTPWYKKVQMAVENKNEFIRVLDSIFPVADSLLMDKNNHHTIEFDKEIRLKKVDVAFIRQKITGYEKAQLSLISDSLKFPELIKNIRSLLSTEKMNGVDAFNSKYVSQPELIACFYKLKTDAVISEFKILNYLYSQINVSDIWLNHIGAFVVPNSQELPIGYPYHAEIFLASYDSTANVNYEIEGQRHEFISGFGSYRQKIKDKPGKYEKQGNFIIKSPIDGEIQEIPFQIEYEVLEKK